MAFISHNERLNTVDSSKDEIPGLLENVLPVSPQELAIFDYQHCSQSNGLSSQDAKNYIGRNQP